MTDTPPTFKNFCNFLNIPRKFFLWRKIVQENSRTLWIILLTYKNSKNIFNPPLHCLLCGLIFAFLPSISLGSGFNDIADTRPTTNISNFSGYYLFMNKNKVLCEIFDHENWRKDNTNRLHNISLINFPKWKIAKNILDRNGKIADYFWATLDYDNNGIPSVIVSKQYVLRSVFVQHVELIPITAEEFLAKKTIHTYDLPKIREASISFHSSAYISRQEGRYYLKNIPKNLKNRFFPTKEYSGYYLGPYSIITPFLFDGKVYFSYLEKATPRFGSDYLQIPVVIFQYVNSGQISELCYYASKPVN